jgi:quinol monooxygenase YgiN
MSVLVTVKIPGDTGKFRQSLTERAGEYEKIAGMARAAGGVHHRFGIGDGFVLVVDEWESADHFGQFFANPELHEFIGSVGGDPGQPEITVTEAVSSPDQY